MRALLVICLGLLCFMQLACERQSAGASGAAKTPASDTSTTQPITVTTQPATVRIDTDQLREQIKQAVQSAKPQTVRLSVDGVVPPANEALVGFRVFVNKPDATAQTKASDPHYAGGLAFSPTASSEPQSFVLNIAPALSKLQSQAKLDLSKALEVTLVPIPADQAHPLPENLSVPVKKVNVSVPN
jgi:hypothetical protein